MNKKDEFSPELTQVLTHMCNMIEVNYDDVDFSSPTLYWDHTWTMAKEEEFIKATHRIFHSKESSSFITIGILEE